MTFDRLAFDGALIVVTGAARGIGAACVELLAARGATVLAVDLSFAEDSPVGRSQSAADVVAADVATAEGWETVRRAVVGSPAGPRGLVNCAGVLGKWPIARTTRAQWDRTMDVNLKGTWLGMKTLGPLIGEAGGGSIVNLSSAAGLDHHPDAAYTASKWGVRGLTKTAAQEFGPIGVRVNSIHPGYIATEMGDAAPEIARRAKISLLPLSRAGQADEVAELVAYLSSDAASFITGAEIAIDGGWTSGVQATAGRRLP